MLAAWNPTTGVGMIAKGAASMFGEDIGHGAMAAGTFAVNCVPEEKTTHYKDGSYTVDGDGWSVEYDRFGNKTKANTGHYMN